MIAYQTKTRKLSGEKYGELKKSVILEIAQIMKKSKRRPYVRSAYFCKQKIFFDFFWQHLFDKSPKQRMERLRYFPPCLDLIKNSRNQPVSMANPHQPNEMLHRFSGLTKNKELFYAQIKENVKTKHKYLMSCFPAN